MMEEEKTLPSVDNNNFTQSKSLFLKAFTISPKWKLLSPNSLTMEKMCIAVLLRGCFLVYNSTQNKSVISNFEKLEQQQASPKMSTSIVV